LIIELNGQTLEYLRRRNQSDVTLDLEEIQSNCCVGVVPELKFHNAPPQNPEKYRYYFVQGINFYISRQLRTENTLTFSLTGLGPFKKLDVSGVNLIL